LKNFTTKYANLSSDVDMDFSTWEKLYLFADGFVSGYYDQRSYPKLNSYNLDELYEYCLEFLRIDMLLNLGNPEFETKNIKH